MIPGVRLALLLALVLAGHAAAQSAMSREEFLASEEDDGWLRIGEFGKRWPGVPIREETARDTIRFRLSSGQVHVCPGYDGYTLKVFFLKAVEGTETVVVFRSENKRGE